MKSYYVSLLVFILMVFGLSFNSPVVKASTDTVEINEALLQTQNYMYRSLKSPGLGNEWYIFNLARSEANVPQSYYDSYYENLVNQLHVMNGVLHKQKYTEYSRVIITLSAIGQDARSVGGYNLVEKLYDFDKVKWQGINGAIFALIALDSKHYNLPEGITNSRQKMIDFILSKQLLDGGFALSGEKGDVDLTAMALQALSAYTNQPAVQETIDKALQFLSNAQRNDGGYSSASIANAESVSQVIVALTSLGIDPRYDARFLTEEGQGTMANLLAFFNSKDGAFRHTVNGDTNSMATEQAALALISYERYIKDQPKLYDMSNVIVRDTTPPNIKLYAVSDRSTTVTGITEADATVQLFVNGRKTQTLVAGGKGRVSFVISPLKAGVKVRMTAIDQAGNSQSTENITVADKTAPEKPNVNKATIQSTAVTGKTEAQATVYVYNGKTKLSSVKANSKGEFNAKIQKQKQGVKLTIYAEDKAKNRSESTIVKVVKK